MAWWRFDLVHLLPRLEAFARLEGKLAIVREPPAQHFAGGAYNRSQSSYVSAERGCCQPLHEPDAHNNYNWEASTALREAVARLAPSVHILPWYELTLRRHATHIGARAACFKRGAAERPQWTRRAECGCDCTHFCYTPLLYDATILTPLYELLRGAPERMQGETGPPPSSAQKRASAPARIAPHRHSHSRS